MSKQEISLEEKIKTEEWILRSLLYDWGEKGETPIQEEMKHIHENIMTLVREELALQQKQSLAALRSEVIDKMGATTAADVTPKEEIEKMGVNQVYFVGGIHAGLQYAKYQFLSLLQDKEEKPTQECLDSLKESEQDYKKGRFTSFKNGKDAIKHLDKLMKEGEEHE